MDDKVLFHAVREALKRFMGDPELVAAFPPEVDWRDERWAVDFQTRYTESQLEQEELQGFQLMVATQQPNLVAANPELAIERAAMEAALLLATSRAASQLAGELFQLKQFISFISYRRETVADLGEDGSIVYSRCVCLLVGFTAYANDPFTPYVARMSWGSLPEGALYLDSISSCNI